MDVVGDYHKNGFAHVRGLIPPEIARAFMTRMKVATGNAPIPLSKPQYRPAVLQRAALDIFGENFEPMSFFLWGLTPTISQLVGREVLPTYNYFRIYRESDICRVHSDRPGSEHGVSLTLDYSDGAIWDLQIGKDRIDSLHPLADDFGSKEYDSVGMEIGDAVLYQASHYAHGRITPNPNGWSAHLFLFYVDRDGPNRNLAFDEQGDFEKVNFTFA